MQRETEANRIGKTLSNAQGRLIVGFFLFFSFAFCFVFLFFFALLQVIIHFTWGTAPYAFLCVAKGAYVPHIDALHMQEGAGAAEI